MEGHSTRGLSEFVADLKFEDIPRDVVEKMKLLVLDTIGAGLLGAGMPWSVRMRKTVQDMEAPGDGSIWGIYTSNAWRLMSKGIVSLIAITFLPPVMRGRCAVV